MYNLYVGNTCYLNSGYKCTQYGSEATGRQNKNMVGLLVDGSYSYGTVPFASFDHSGTNVYDYNGSIVEEYVNNYKSLLETDYNISIAEARLISKEELKDPNTFACVEVGACSNNYPWIFGMSYWSSYYSEPHYIFAVNNRLGEVFPDGFTANYEYGVRPVIEVPKTFFN